MASVNIPLGTTDYLTQVYSYPNDPDSSECLSDTILHWFNQTLERDGFKAEGATATVTTEGDSLTLVVNGPDAIHEYGTRLPEFLQNGFKALQIIEELKTETKVWPKGLTILTEDKLWDPQNTGKWRFFLPFGMAMINQTTLNFFHYPPMRLLDQMRDYLKDPVPDRLIQMLKICGLQTEQEAWLYSTVMDCAPIAAPDNQGTQSIGKYGEPGAQSVHLIPIDRFHEYQRSQVQILLNTSSQNENFTVPIVVFGTPATRTFNALYKDQLGGQTLRDNQALVADGIIEGKKTAVIAAGHPYRFYMAAQGEAGTGRLLPGKNCVRAVHTMKEDLATIGWQIAMAKDPSQDPVAVYNDSRSHWDAPEQAATVCQLVQYQASLWYPDPKSLEFTWKLSMDEAASLCANSGNDPCAAAGS
jgi:hypothetical protein